MGPGDLAQVLEPLKARASEAQAAHPALLVGLGVADDAAVYRLSPEQALIQTVDFFTPIVDDPRDYGRIAAANSLSDVYAMGGEALLALNIGGFPDTLPHAMISEILLGAEETVRAAGAVIAGGHTVIDAEPKFGLVVTGTVHPDRIVTIAGARPGDALFLTKALGTGLITTAARGDHLADPAHLAEAVASMRRLNREAAAAMRAVGIGPEGVHACTDITGFGLLGHTGEMAEASNVACHLSVEALPLLAGARLYAEQGYSPGGAGRNRSYFSRQVRLHDDTVDRALASILWDPQTSGGLLIAVAEAHAEALAAELTAREVLARRIGTVEIGTGVYVG
jgi:selenide,water dikinase